MDLRTHHCDLPVYRPSTYFLFDTSTTSYNSCWHEHFPTIARIEFTLCKWTALL